MAPHPRNTVDALMDATSRRSAVTRSAWPVRVGSTALAVALALSGCATSSNPPGAGAPVSGSPAGTRAVPGTAPAAPPPTALVNEQRWLEQWFKGTPVGIGLQGGNVLEVAVPQAHSFEAGSSTPKPALSAVLDRVAESLRRQTGTRVSVIAATDAGGPPALAQTRAAKVRDHLVGRSVAATRVSIAPAAGAGAGVQLRISVVPQPIARLDDSTLPVPASGVKPVSGSRPAAPVGDGKAR
jgi:outer membrane protein OmpA-like peptidoglycan-associated protein